jgi:hypothetical protein
MLILQAAHEGTWLCKNATFPLPQLLTILIYILTELLFFFLLNFVQIVKWDCGERSFPS